MAPSDVRLTKSYYDYYYSFSHSRNPRLPKPLIDWSHQDGSDGAPGGGIGGGPAGIGGGHGPGIGGGHGLGMGESAFPRMGSAGTGMGSKQARTFGPYYIGLSCIRAHVQLLLHNRRENEFSWLFRYRYFQRVYTQSPNKMPWCARK